MIFNKVMEKFQYFGDMSSMHGIRYVVSTNNIPFAKRLFWSSILIACCLGASAILKSSLSVFSAGATSFSVMTDYLDWDTSFPAMTICEEADNKRVEAYLNQNNLPISLSTFYKDVAYWNKKYCRSCDVCEYNVTCLENFLEGIKKIRLECSELLTQCWWGGKLFRCCDKFHPIETEYGTCYVFNSALLGNVSEFTVNRRIGLPALVFSATAQVLIRVHSPEDIVSVMMEKVLGQFESLPWISNFDATLKAEQTVNDPSVKFISPSVRGCLFGYERPPFDSWPFKKYTNSACLLFCRAKSQHTYCNCTHHFLANIVKMPACSVKGLACLYNNKDNLLKFECNCPMSCDDILYKIVHVFFNRVTGKLPPDLLARGSRARTRLAQLPTLRLRRFAIRDNLGLVVDIGGVIGIFFGASLLSVMEVIYLFCIRRN